MHTMYEPVCTCVNIYDVLMCACGGVCLNWVGTHCAYVYMFGVWHVHACVGAYMPTCWYSHVIYLCTHVCLVCKHVHGYTQLCGFMCVQICSLWVCSHGFVSMYVDICALMFSCTVLVCACV